MPVDPSPYTHDGVPMAQLLTDLAASAAASLAQTPDGIPTVTGYFHDQPAEDCCSAVQLWVREWVPVVAGEFPTQASTTDRCSFIDMDPRVVLSLRRPCAPIPDDDGFVDAAVDRAIANGLVIDLRALMCGVFADWPGILQTNYPGARLFYGPATAVGANTACPGWDWEIFVEVFGCRGACS